DPPNDRRALMAKVTEGNRGRGLSERGDLDKEQLEAGVVAAAFAWAAARKAWEATSRAVERPSNLGTLKGDVRRAERELMARVTALREALDPGSGPRPPAGDRVSDAWSGPALPRESGPPAPSPPGSDGDPRGSA